MTGIILGIKTLLETFKAVGLIRDRKQESDIHTQFLMTTSGPFYSLARVSVIYASGWDIWFNEGRKWAATGMPAWLELVPIIWLFIGPAIVPLAEAGLRQSKVLASAFTRKEGAPTIGTPPATAPGPRNPARPTAPVTPGRDDAPAAPER